MVYGPNFTVHLVLKGVEPPSDEAQQCRQIFTARSRPGDQHITTKRNMHMKFNIHVDINTCVYIRINTNVNEHKNTSGHINICTNISSNARLDMNINITITKYEYAHIYIYIHIMNMLYAIESYPTRARGRQKLLPFRGPRPALAKAPLGRAGLPASAAEAQSWPSTLPRDESKRAVSIKVGVLGSL